MEVVDGPFECQKCGDDPMPLHQCPHRAEFDEDDDIAVV